MTTTDDARAAKAAFDEHAWSKAYERLSSADTSTTLHLDDLERLAVSAYLTGRDEASTEAWARAHSECQRLNDIPRAARCAFWLALGLMNRGEWAQASGWLSRARRLLDEAQVECAEQGLLLLLVVRTALKEGDIATAQQAASRASELSRRFEDAALEVFDRLVTAQLKARRGDETGAVALFDEIMVAVMTGDVAPIAVGILYCAVIDGCYALFDVGRAREWTEALSAWCATQPDLVPFRGQCLVRRVEIMRMSGAWSDAQSEAEHACDWLVRSAGERDTLAAGNELQQFKYPIGAAFYQLAELHRMRGDYPAAEAAYRQTSEYGRSPEPGLSQLRMAEGRIDEAGAAIRRLLGERQGRLTRAGVLSAAADVLLAARDVPAARAVADELAGLAPESDTPYLRALVGQATGSVLLAEGDARGALTAFGEAWIGWQEIEAPYDAARVRVMRGLACRALGDDAAAELELDAALRVFERLSAEPDVARVAALRRPAIAHGGAGILSPREREVIALVATGKTNQDIAAELGISKRTVDRHVSNILMKLNVSSRAGATAYAYEHGLL